MFARLIIASLVSTAAYSPAMADSTKGKILAYDRKAKIIVLSDKTVWTVEGSEGVIPADLVAGDQVEIDFESAGEDGLTKIDAMKKIAQ